MNFELIQTDDLIPMTKLAVKAETNATTNIVRHLVEIFKRDLYLARGFSSMHELAVKELGYDKPSATRRTHAMELALKAPKVLEKIESGELCLQSAADIQTFLNRERGLKKPYSVEKIIAFVDEVSGLSTRKVQIHLATLNPEISFRESKKFVSKDRLQITYTTSVSIEEKLERIKELRSEAAPYMTREELLDYMAEIVLEAIDPVRRDERVRKQKAKRAQQKEKVREHVSAEVASDATKSQGEIENQPIVFAAPIREDVVSDAGEIQLAIEFDRGSPLPNDSTLVPAPVLKRTRYISAENERAVRQASHDQGCAWVDELTGRRCASTHQLQRDHVHEYSRGGSNDAENLAILCAKHNRFRWRQRSDSFVREAQQKYGA